MKNSKKLLSTTYLSGYAAIALLSGVGLVTITANSKTANAYVPAGCYYDDLGNYQCDDSSADEYQYTDDSDDMTDDYASADKCANSAKPTCASNEQRECWVTYEDIPTKKEAQKPTYIWRCVPKN